MKKVLCLLLCMVLLVGVLVSCGGDETPDPAVTTTAPSGGEQGGNNGTTAQPPVGGGTTAQPPVGGGTTAQPPVGGGVKTSPTHDPEDFRDALGNARVYNVMVRASRYAYFHGSEDSTNTVTKAAYKRNMKLNEMYGIDFKVTEVASAAADWNTALATASGEYDLALPDYWWGLEYAGHFENVMTVNEINDADDWWVQGWNDNMIINNRMYTFVGDAALEIYENIEVIFFNKTIEEEYDYDLYDTVNSGKWTVDEMIYTIEVFSDALTDNDEDNDVYGVMYDAHSIKTAMYSCGVTLLQTNRNNGIISVIANTTRNVNVSDKLSELCNHTSTLYQSTTARAISLDPFINSQAFMYAGCLWNGTKLKAANTVFDYGIIVCPKYEESDDYRSTAYGVSFFGLPTTASDMHISAVVCDTMNWLSSTKDERGMGDDNIVDTYYNTVLKGLVASSPADYKQLDMARDTSYYDFGFIINADVKLESGFTSAIISGTSVSTTMSNLISAAEAGLTDMLDFYNK